jgi:hypothetical protein
MDDRKPPDINVVRLRRNGDLSDEERQRLASTIFADQDEVGTFSRGNLVPPAPSAPPASTEPPAADPFFEQLQTQASNAKHHPAADVNQLDATAEYFDRLGSQTPAEMTQGISPHPAGAGMPGSANLPKELMPTKRRRSRPQRTPTSPPGRSHSRRRVRVAAPPLLIALGAVAVAGTALAAIVGGGEHGAPVPQRLASKHTSAPSARVVVPTTAADLMAALSRPSIRHHTAPQRTSGARRRHPAQKVHVVLAADRQPAHTSSSSSSASVANVNHTSTQTVQPSPVVQQIAAQATDTASSSGSNTSSGGSASSGGGSRPAFGANGTLGPGHSPNG